MAKVFDLVIIGAGPAGITAAVYAARKKMDVLVLSLEIGGQAARSGDIENYTGYQFVTGPELTLKFQEHMNKFGIKVNAPERLRRVVKIGELISIASDKGEYLAKTAVIATGKRPRPLNVEGESQFRNKGLLIALSAMARCSAVKKWRLSAAATRLLTPLCS